jgi:hypothetical protein
MCHPKRVTNGIVDGIDGVASDEETVPFVFLFDKEIILHNGPERFQLSLWTRETEVRRERDKRERYVDRDRQRQRVRETRERERMGHLCHSSVPSQSKADWKLQHSSQTVL